MVDSDPLSPLPAKAADGGPFTLETALLGPLPVPDGAARAADLADLARRAAVYATRARGDGTRRAYRSAWQQYAAWCASLAREPLGADPDTIAMYVVRLADQGLAVSTIRVALAAIRTAHLLAGRSIDLRHPSLAMVLEGITRSKGVRPRRQAAPAVPGLTAGGDNQAQLADLMRQSRHRSAQSVLGYIEPADLWRNNVTEGVFRSESAKPPPAQATDLPEQA